MACVERDITDKSPSSLSLLLLMSYRGHGRTHNYHNRGRSQTPMDPIKGADPFPQDLQPSESSVGGPEQSPLGRSPSSRTYSSANHLLNFQYDSYANHGRDSRGRGGNDSRGRGAFRRPAAKPMPYNRNKFLQANFRFLVSDAGNLKKHEADADLMLDWDDVVQVGLLFKPTCLHCMFLQFTAMFLHLCCKGQATQLKSPKVLWNMLP